MQTVLASADSAVRKQIGEFHICSFDGLTTRELYEILRAREIYLESQKHAEGFYLKAGFETMSADFVEAGIPHVQMRRNLAAAAYPYPEEVKTI